MQRFVTIFLVLLFVGISCIGCDYLNADDSCYPTQIVDSCREYDTMLEHCNPDVFPNVNGCFTVEVCPSNVQTKAADNESDADADADADDDSDSSASSFSLPAPAAGCHYECQGEPVPCKVLDEEECGETVYCQWWNDPNNLDKGLD